MLKAQQIKDAKHSGVGKAPLKLSDGNGLQLHVFANGRKTWIYSYRYNGNIISENMKCAAIRGKIIENLGWQ